MPSTNTRKSYVCVTDCFFMGKLWRAGTFVEFAAGVKPPRHFEENVPPKAPKPKTAKELQAEADAAQAAADKAKEAEKEKAPPKKKPAAKKDPKPKE